jgi:hypothetical protein
VGFSKIFHGNVLDIPTGAINEIQDGLVDLPSFPTLQHDHRIRHFGYRIAGKSCFSQSLLSRAGLKGRFSYFRHFPSSEHGILTHRQPG